MAASSSSSVDSSSRFDADVTDLKTKIFFIEERQNQEESYRSEEKQNIDRLTERVDDLERKLFACRRFIDQARMQFPQIESIDLTNYSLVRCCNQACSQYWIPVKSTVYLCKTCGKPLVFQCPSTVHTSGFSFRENDDFCKECNKHPILPKQYWTEPSETMEDRIVQRVISKLLEKDKKDRRDIMENENSKTNIKMEDDTHVKSKKRKQNE